MNICTHCNTENENEIVNPSIEELVDMQCFHCGTVLTESKIAELAESNE